ncbi:MAG: proton-conducting transporter transmembrane domain-containing protein, partial [Chloroflexota bacterium]
VYSLWSLWIVILAVVSAVYGAVVAMAQPDLKRLVAISSVNHMGYVLLAIGVAAAAFASPADRTAATSGAVYQMVAHGLATGGLFFLVGILSERTGTREIRQLSGLWAAVPLYGSILAFTAFASLGLPALVHFAAEVQIVLAALGVYPWAAAAMLLGVLITTAMFLWTLQRVLMGPLPERWTVLPRLSGRELAILLPLVGLILLLGVVPGPLTDLVHAAAQLSQVTPLALGR